ncbi:MAG: hypothetical protein DRI39_10120, partial [Chloroflexi bacterium]
MSETAITSIEPRSAPVGASIQVSGTISTQDGEYAIHWDTTESKPIVTGKAKGQEVRQTVTVPSAVGGQHQIFLVDVAEKASASSALTVLAKTELALVTGSVGTKVPITGANFPAGVVSIQYDGEKVAEANANDKGTFRSSFTVPHSAAGQHKVTTDPPSREHVFSVTPSLVASPTSGTVRQDVKLEGSGFPAARKVSVRYDGSEVAAPTADAKGSFQASFAVPASTDGE